MGPFQKLRSVKTILVTNTSSYSVGSMIAIDLAMRFVKNREKTILIDGDLRHPTVHRHLGAANSIGLSDFLYDQHSLSSVVKTAENSGLSFITGGSYPINIFDIFNTEKMRDHLELIKEDFDKVVIQGPPFFFKEALSLASLVESVLLLIHAGYNQSETSRVLIEKFQHSGASVVGIAMRSPNPHPVGQPGFVGNLLNFDNPGSQFSNPGIDHLSP